MLVVVRPDESNEVVVLGMEETEKPVEDSRVPVLVALVVEKSAEVDGDVVAEDGGPDDNPEVVSVVHTETVMVEVTVVEVQEAVTVTVTVGKPYSCLSLRTSGWSLRHSWPKTPKALRRKDMLCQSCLDGERVVVKHHGQQIYSPQGQKRKTKHSTHSDTQASGSFGARDLRSYITANGRPLELAR